MQLPQTHTTVVRLCYTLVVVQKLLCACYIHPLHSDLVVLSCKMSPASHATPKLQLSYRQSSYHTPSQATTGLEAGRQHHTEHRRRKIFCVRGATAPLVPTPMLNGIVANSSGALLVKSPSVASNSEQCPLCTTWCIHITVTTIVDCWLVKIIVL